MTQVPGKLDGAAPIVLLVDDCRDVHRLLGARLRSEHIDLVGAFSGEEGLELARELKPALVLLDLDMHGIDGFEVLRRLKDRPETLHLPVIVLSGKSNPQDKVTAFDLGVVDYLTKPFDLTELRVRLRSALRIHSLVQMLAQRAQIDGMTGLWNRDCFDRRWLEETERSKRHQRPLSLALLDLDRFKAINDTYGHPAGDAVIQGTAQLLQQIARASDICCRYGGEEFAVIMPDTAPRDAEKLFDRVRLALEETAWPKHPDRKVTISVGIAGTTGGSVLERVAWLEAADRALYASKAQGRNRVSVTEFTDEGPRLADAG